MVYVIKPILLSFSRTKTAFENLYLINQLQALATRRTPFILFLAGIVRAAKTKQTLLKRYPLLYSLTGIAGVASNYRTPKQGQPRTPFLEARNAGAEQLN